MEIDLIQEHQVTLLGIVLDLYKSIMECLVVCKNPIGIVYFGDYDNATREGEIPGPTKMYNWHRYKAEFWITYRKHFILE